MPLPYVSIVEPRTFVAEVLSHAVRSVCPGMPIVRERTGKTALKNLNRSPAVLVVVALALPDMNGLSLIVSLVKRNLSKHVILVTDQRDACVDCFVRQASAGVIDLRTDSTRSVKNAIRATLAGKKRLPPEWQTAFGTDQDIFINLTPRELEVLASIGCGDDDRDVAAQLELSAATIHTHRQSIMRKLGARKRSELIRASIASGAVKIGANWTAMPVLACIRTDRGKLV
jgi:DNA-binding NarL/FixJ family response regulator